MQAYKGNVWLHLFLTSTPDASEYFTSRPGHCAPGEEPQHPLNRRLGGPQNQSGRFGEVNIFFPTVIRTPDRPAPSLVTVLTTPTRLSSHNHNVVKGAVRKSRFCSANALSVTSRLSSVSCQGRLARKCCKERGNLISRLAAR